MLYVHEIDDRRARNLRVALLGLFGALVATVLMGSADPGATSPAMRGGWEVIVDAQPGECGGGGRRRFDLVVAENGVRVTKPGATYGEALRAGADGNGLFFEVRYGNESGAETIERVELTMQDGIMQGTSSYTAVGARTMCSGQAGAFATR